MATTSHVSRRSLITAVSATLAGTAVAAAPLTFAKASAPDPVFAALEAYRSAFDAHMAACDATDATQPGPERTTALAAQMQACEADSEAWWALIETQPTTTAGLIALVRFLADHPATFDLEACTSTVMRTIAGSLEAMSSGRSA